MVKEENDIDIVLQDGGYAFSWIADGVRKIECHQDRINYKLNDFDNFLTFSKAYMLDYLDIDTTIEFIIKSALNWLIPNLDEDLKVTIVELKDQKLEDLINDFLKLK